LQKEDILNELINALYDEISKVVRELQVVRGDKRRRSLRYVLRDLSLALGRLLDRMPEREGELDEWLQEVASKVPKKYIKGVKEALSSKKVWKP